MITNQPSLAELLTAYKNNGAADAINAGVQGLQTGMGIAAGRQQAQLTQQNKLSELSNQQMTAQAEQQRAAAATKEAQAKFMRAGDAERLAGVAPGTFSADSNQMVPTTAIDATNAMKTRLLESQNQIAAIKANKEATLAQIASNAQLADETRRAQQAMQAQNAANTNLTNATNSFEKLPWYTGVMHSFGHDTQGYQAADTSLKHAQSQAVGQPQSVLGQTPAPKVNYTATATHADGSKIGFNPATNKWEPIQQ